jgi:hypothetical protein
MTTVQTVGAVSRDAAEWFAIDWQAVNRNVRRLQVRIVQAIKAGRWNKVKALQRLPDLLVVPSPQFQSKASQLETCFAAKAQ